MMMILKYPSTVISLFFICVIVLCVLIPSGGLRSRVTLCILLVVLSVVLIKKADKNEDEIEHQLATLKKNIESMTSHDNTGYHKNNEEIPLRRTKHFKYVFLEPNLIKLINNLFYFQRRYKDVVFSVVLYSEAFMRQITRMMEGKVKDPAKAKTLGERILNQLHTLVFMSSKYETKTIEKINKNFELFVWDTYRMGLERIDRGYDAYEPSEFDSMIDNRFELHIL